MTFTPGNRHTLTDVLTPKGHKLFNGGPIEILGFIPASTAPTEEQCFEFYGVKPGHARFTTVSKPYKEDRLIFRYLKEKKPRELLGKYFQFVSTPVSEDAAQPESESAVDEAEPAADEVTAARFDAAPLDLIIQEAISNVQNGSTLEDVLTEVSALPEVTGIEDPEVRNVWLARLKTELLDATAKPAQNTPQPERLLVFNGFERAVAESMQIGQIWQYQDVGPDGQPIRKRLRIAELTDTTAVCDFEVTYEKKQTWGRGDSLNFEEFVKGLIALKAELDVEAEVA